MWSSRMSLKSIATCFWFQILFIFRKCVNTIWNQTLVKLYNIRVYIQYSYHRSSMSNVIATRVWFWHSHLHISKWNKSSETSNMSLPTSDSFSLIVTQNWDGWLSVFQACDCCQFQCTVVHDKDVVAGRKCFLIWLMHFSHYTFMLWSSGINFAQRVATYEHSYFVRIIVSVMWQSYSFVKRKNDESCFLVYDYSFSQTSVNTYFSPF